jgi:hypothetical protein
MSVSLSLVCVCVSVVVVCVTAHASAAHARPRLHVFVRSCSCAAACAAAVFPPPSAPSVYTPLRCVCARPPFPRASLQITAPARFLTVHTIIHTQQLQKTKQGNTPPPQPVVTVARRRTARQQQQRRHVSTRRQRRRRCSRRCTRCLCASGARPRHAREKHTRKGRVSESTFGGERARRCEARARSGRAHRKPSASLCSSYTLLISAAARVEARGGGRGGCRVSGGLVRHKWRHGARRKETSLRSARASHTRAQCQRRRSGAAQRSAAVPCAHAGARTPHSRTLFSTSVPSARRAAHPWAAARCL